MNKSQHKFSVTFVAKTKRQGRIIPCLFYSKLFFVYSLIGCFPRTCLPSPRRPRPQTRQSPKNRFNISGPRENCCFKLGTYFDWLLMIRLKVVVVLSLIFLQ